VDESHEPGNPLVILILHTGPALEEGMCLSREEFTAEALAGLTRAREDRDAAEAQLAQAKRQVLHGSGDKAARVAAWEASLAEFRAACTAHGDAVRVYQWAKSR
jgi:hypothetical protein